jgi:hypothetical protein
MDNFGGELEAMNIALMELFSRIGSFQKAVTFSDSTATVQSLAQVATPSSKGVTETPVGPIPLQGYGS